MPPHLPLTTGVPDWDLLTTSQVQQVEELHSQRETHENEAVHEVTSDSEEHSGSTVDLNVTHPSLLSSINNPTLRQARSEELLPSQSDQLTLTPPPNLFPTNPLNESEPRRRRNAFSFHNDDDGNPTRYPEDFRAQTPLAPQPNRMANAAGIRWTDRADTEFMRIIRDIEASASGPGPVQLPARLARLLHGEGRERHVGLGGRREARQRRMDVVENERSRRRFLAFERSLPKHPKTDEVIGGLANNTIRTWNEEKEEREKARKKHRRTWPDIVKKAREKVALFDAKKAAEEAAANEERAKRKAERKKKRSTATETSEGQAVSGGGDSEA